MYKKYQEKFAKYPSFSTYISFFSLKLIQLIKCNKNKFATQFSYKLDQSKFIKF